MIYKFWMSEFLEEDSAFGDLAEDITKDANFPESNEYEELKEYLYKTGASDKAMETFEQTFKLFTR